MMKKIFNKAYKDKIEQESLLGIEELVENIRMRQHNFDNQVNAMKSLLYTAASLDDLKEKMSEYYKELQFANRFNKILTSIENPVIAGFIFSKLSEAERNNIEVSYSITLWSPIKRIKVYDYISILGILIDNAIEENLKYPAAERKLELKICAENENNVTEISNTCHRKDIIEIDRMFTRNYSTKGPSRGLGLFAVKMVLRKNGGSILVKNKIENEKNMISFSLHDI